MVRSVAKQLHLLVDAQAICLVVIVSKPVLGVELEVFEDVPFHNWDDDIVRIDDTRWNYYSHHRQVQDYLQSPNQSEVPPDAATQEHIRQNTSPKYHF